MTKFAYKLLRVRRDGSLGSLFINRRAVLPVNTWLRAEYHPTKGYREREGWHALANRRAPHLSEVGRAWFLVELKGVSVVRRPESQGGLWYIAQEMRIVRRDS